LTPKLIWVLYVIHSHYKALILFQEIMWVLFQNNTHFLRGSVASKVNNGKGVRASAK